MTDEMKTRLDNLIAAVTAIYENPPKDGVTPIFRASNTAIQVSTDNGKNYTDLVTLESLKGADGTSIDVKSIEPVMNDLRQGFKITFSNNDNFTIYNGNDGEKGATGDNGIDGRGIVSFTEEVVSNGKKYTFTYTDQTTSSFTIESPIIPIALKNPNALTIKIGDTTYTYDGSEPITIEIPST